MIEGMENAKQYGVITLTDPAPVVIVAELAEATDQLMRYKAAGQKVAAAQQNEAMEWRELHSGLTIEEWQERERG